MRREADEWWIREGNEWWTGYLRSLQGAAEGAEHDRNPASEPALRWWSNSTEIQASVTFGGAEHNRNPASEPVAQSTAKMEAGATEHGMDSRALTRSGT